MKSSKKRQQQEEYQEKQHPDAHAVRTHIKKTHNQKAKKKKVKKKGVLTPHPQKIPLPIPQQKQIPPHLLTIPIRHRIHKPHKLRRCLQHSQPLRRRPPHRLHEPVTHARYPEQDIRNRVAIHEEHSAHVGRGRDLGDREGRLADGFRGGGGGVLVWVVVDVVGGW